MSTVWLRAWEKFPLTQKVSMEQKGLCCVTEPISIDPSIAGSITHDSFPLSSEAAPSAQLQALFKPLYLRALGFASWKLR